MSQTGKFEGASCEKGRGITHPGAFTRHANACDACDPDTSEPDSGENGGIRASDLQMEEIADAVQNADADTLDATLALHEYAPGDKDTREDAAAKALIRAKNGGKEAYATVFGDCPHDGCEYGRNGLRAEACSRHEGEGETSEGEAETSENGASDDEVRERVSEQASEPERETASAEGGEAKMAAYVAKLIENGVSPEQAQEAANARFA